MTQASESFQGVGEAGAPGAPPGGSGEPGTRGSLQLTRPEALTPLPLADRALPTLALFERLAGGAQARYRVATLRNLATRSVLGMSLDDLQAALPWLQPRSATRLVGQLRDGGLLDQDADRSYRLPAAARVVGALCAVLMVPEVDYSGIVRALGRLMSFTRDLGGDEQAALVPFRMALAVCEEDVLLLRRLLEENSVAALGEAAELGHRHATHMRELLGEQQGSHPALGADPEWISLSDRANQVVARLLALSAAVLASLAEAAEGRLRGGGRLERDDIRAFVAATPPAELAGVLGTAWLEPPRLLAYLPSEGLGRLDAIWGAASRRRPSPPTPVHLSSAVIPPASPDPADEMTAALGALASRGGGPLAEVVVGGSWPEAVGRFAGLMESWVRDGPPGRSTLAADIHFVAGLAPVGRDEVEALTPSEVVPRTPPGGSPP
jgi:hypothetical protein